jgi:hypothetical protein
MVVPLGIVPVDALPVRFVEGHAEREWGGASHVRLYTCRHWQPATRTCGNYENRPNLCRRFPYGQACCYADCTMTADDPGYEYEGEKRPIRIVSEEGGAVLAELPPVEVLGAAIVQALRQAAAGVSAGADVTPGPT